MICLSTILGIANTNTYYVNIGLSNGNNDGSSWADTFQTFAAAISAANTNAGADDIYIKGSIFKTATWAILL